MVAKFKPHQTWYDYTYAYPDGYIEGGIDMTDIVFYVGKGTHGRIDDHEKEAQKGCHCEKCRTIRKIWARGYPVKKRIVFETFREGESLNKEQELLKIHAGKYLTNIIIPDQVAFNQDQPVRYLNAIQAAKRIGVDAKTVRRWLQKGKLTARRTELGHLAISEVEIERVRVEWEEERAQFATPTPALAPNGQIESLIAKVASLEQRIAALERGEM